MGNKPVLIRNILPNVLSKFGLKKGIERQKPLIMWDKVVGPEIRKHTRALKVRGDKLFVEVDDPIWAQELSFLRGKIIEKLKRETGRARLSIIFCTKKF
jgi:predicted nucleic acid-binding Zn ribbon protein